MDSSAARKPDLKTEAIAGITTFFTMAYIESIAGISMGGRTGLTSVFTALCFLPCFFIAPVAGMVPAYACRSDC